MKKFTKIISLISVGFALVGVALLNTSQSSQASYVGKSRTCTWKSAANITTGWFTIHGRGYSYPNSGKVTSAWITSGSALFNSIINKSHWTYKTPRGVHLMGKATDRATLGTEWIYIPLGSDTQAIGVQF